MNRLFAISFLLLASSCHAPEASDPEAAIVGRWAMERIYEEGDDVTAQHDPFDNRWVAFSEDGSFVSAGDPYGRNAGTWTFDAETQELYLDSDAGEGDDSYWIVRIEKDTMQWTGARSDFTERFEIVHAKQGPNE